MPYEVRKNGERWCVYNTDTEDEKACHDSEEDAEAQVKLLHKLEADE